MHVLTTGFAMVLTMAITTGCEEVNSDSRNSRAATRNIFRPEIRENSATVVLESGTASPTQMSEINGTIGSRKTRTSNALGLVAIKQIMFGTAFAQFASAGPFSDWRLNRMFCVHSIPAVVAQAACCRSMVESQEYDYVNFQSSMY